jgi:hypothetical protein|tara:strand:+ start:2437 stop:2571 length:135 start_codon:yes stop_codon:yes gene_type:complete
MKIVFDDDREDIILGNKQELKKNDKKVKIGKPKKGKSKRNAKKA